MPDPIAYLLTWTCHGSWLHGDRRGSVDYHHRDVGSSYLSPNVHRHDHDKTAMSSPAVTLNPAARDVVRSTILSHAEIRTWTLHAVNARSKHVHLVVSCDIPPLRAMEQFKAWSTRRLREAGLFPAGHSIWTEGGSRRNIWNATQLARAIDYVMDQQGDEVR